MTLVALVLAAPLAACAPQSPAPAPAAAPPDMRALIAEYQADRGALRRLWSIPLSDRAHRRMETLDTDWQARLDDVDFAALDRDAQVDCILLANLIASERSERARRSRESTEISGLTGFAPPLAGVLEDFALRADPPSGREAAELLAAAAAEVAAATDGLDMAAEGMADTAVNRAAGQVSALRRAVDEWVRFRDGYDPQFGWWTGKPADALREALDGYAAALRKRAGTDDRDRLLGDPIGPEALSEALRHAMIAYTPLELIAVAESEWAWCEREMLRASQELGFGDDWRAALDHVKNLHVEPGAQPHLIRTLADEAVAFLEERDLVTIPALCKETWRMRMMSAERQRVTPYFTGGEVISIAFPTDTMEHADKLMALRGNNAHFSRATVHHELIPGHHLQQYMNARHATWRRPFGTPFWGEGWALYWELRLWDLDFPRGPEDRIGMLFWRMHRCARILFSLNFHLGEWTADACVDFLVERVGHERRNATAEVRRSVGGSYGPLYQAAYMTGGLQLEALQREAAEALAMSDKDFHDFVLRNGSIPIEMLRALLFEELELEREFTPRWRFHSPR